MPNRQNEYNSKVTTLQLSIDGNDPLVVGSDYTLDLPTIYGEDYLRFTNANGSSVSPVFGPALPFNIEDRPILRDVRLVCNFADGLVFTEHQIQTFMLVNNVNSLAGDGFQYTGTNSLPQIQTSIPLLNTQIDIARFVSTTKYSSTPPDFPNISDVFQDCAFMYFRAFAFTWNTNTIDSAYDGLVPKFILEAEVEHTFDLRAVGGCNVI